MNRFAVTLCLLASLATCAQAFGQAPAGHSSSRARVISASERSALVALFEATDGNHWKNHNGWFGAPGTECDWYGVVCEPAGSDDAAVVTSVDLMQNNLRGHVPAEITGLAHLKTLFLYGNELSGMLPDSMIQRWLSGDLWVNMEAPLLTKVTEIDMSMRLLRFSAHNIAPFFAPTPPRRCSPSVAKIVHRRIAQPIAR